MMRAVGGGGLVGRDTTLIPAGSGGQMHTDCVKHYDSAIRTLHGCSPVSTAQLSHMRHPGLAIFILYSSPGA